MAFRHRSRTSEQDPQTRELLHDLLLTPPPPSETPLRPVALRSQAEQRHIALRSFLQRTWFDKTLSYAERLLVAVVVLFFGYWFLDGYGRDLLHAWQTPPVASAVRQNDVPSSFVPPVQQPSEPSSGSVASALPFTTPAMEQPIDPPDYLVPGVMPALPPVGDQRPQRLIAPSIELDSPVAEVFVVDGVWQVADYAVGYHHGTALPGEQGNTVMAGHAGLRGGVFRDLGSLTPGADVWIIGGGWRYHYRVREATSVWPNQVEVMNATPTPVLTLITCTAWDTQRLVVVADLIDARPDTGES